MYLIPLFAGLWSGLGLHRIYKLLLKPLYIHKCSCSAVSSKCFLSVISLSSNYTLSSPSSTMIPKPWDAGCGIYLPIRAEIPYLFFSSPWPVMDLGVNHRLLQTEASQGEGKRCMDP